MKMTLRWFGEEDDSMSLDKTRQIPAATGVVSAINDVLDRIINLVDSPYNGLTVCSGCLGENPKNNIPEIVSYFGEKGRMIGGEVARPGYGLYDRALGITYLNGLWEAISKMKAINNSNISK